LWENKGVVIKDAGLTTRKWKLSKAQQNSHKIEIPAMCDFITARATWKSLLAM
jgi:hypothetical protein